MLIRTMFALLFVVLIVCLLALPFRRVIGRYFNKKRDEIGEKSASIQSRFDLYEKSRSGLS